MLPRDMKKSKKKIYSYMYKKEFQEHDYVCFFKNNLYSLYGARTIINLLIAHTLKLV